MRLDFHPEALEEYEAAARYYGRRNPEVGRRFVEAVEEAIQRMLEAPFAWQRLDDQFRRCTYSHTRSSIRRGQSQC